jgi:hypothetical protein
MKAPVASVIVYAICLGACVTHYTAPTPQEAHAVLKIRRVYEAAAGTRLSEAMNLDEDQAFAAEVSAASGATPRIDAILVHPRPAMFRIGVGFSHEELRYVQESYTVQTPYMTMQSYNCGSYNRYQTCTRSVTQYRSDIRYRTVMRSVSVSDGSCSQGMPLSPENGKTYLVELTYRGSNVCSLACYEQIANPEGGFINRSCGMTGPIAQ